MKATFKACQSKANLFHDFNIENQGLVNISLHLLSPSLDFRKIGLFTFFSEPSELKEFNPIPPKVNTGILMSFSAVGSIFDSLLEGESIFSFLGGESKGF